MTEKVKPRIIATRKGVIKLFHYSEPVINPEKVRKHQVMKETGITGKQFRRAEKKLRAKIKAGG